MGVTPSGGRTLSLDTLVRVKREQREAEASRRLVLPEEMTTPLGCDAVAVPADLGPLLMPRLPRVGCVYDDGTHWWWIVPSDSDYALEWPAPSHYAAGALVPDAPRTPRLIHHPGGTIPYTPPIPLYLTLCRLTGVTPAWSHTVSA
ncbi:hypothetical protein ACFY93_18905 [Streptomyces sp. NPDC008313]|uniref:hypothetical protein n=1 Tax=Streptomyces sp. NPDC008313 TaxID=3364826 RepID=UPI0036E4239C